MYDEQLTYIGSLGALFNGLMKILLASSLDCIRFKLVFLMVLALIIFSLIAVHWFVNNYYLFAMCIWINLMGDGSMTSMLPVVTI